MPAHARPAVVRGTGAVLAAATALLLSGCAPLDPVVEPAPGPTEQPVTGALLAVESVGGMCPTDECRHVVTLHADGRWRTEDEAGVVVEGRASSATVTQVVAAVTTADREALVATPFTGECERHWDGSETVLTLRPGEPDELVLPGCTYQLPPTGPLADAAQAVLELARP